MLARIKSGILNFDVLVLEFDKERSKNKELVELGLKLGSLERPVLGAMRPLGP